MVAPTLTFSLMIDVADTDNFVKYAAGHLEEKGIAKTCDRILKADSTAFKSPLPEDELTKWDRPVFRF